MSDHLPPPPQPGGGAWNAVGPYGQQQMQPIVMRRLGGLSTALVVLFALIALADVVAATAFFHRSSLLNDILDGQVPIFSDVANADDRVQTGVGLHIVGVLVIAVVFIIWQWRHAKNAEALGSRGGLGPGWAIGGWFIPFANYVLPGLQIFQSSRASDLVSRAQGRQGRGAGIVVVWACFLGLANGLFLLGGGLAPETDDQGNFLIESMEDVQDTADSDRTAGLAMLAYVAAAGAGAVMVQQLSRRQSVAIQGVNVAITGQPAPQPSWGAGPAPAWGTPTPSGAPPPPQPPTWGAPPAPPPGPPPGQWGAPPPPPPPPPAPPAQPPGQWGAPPPPPPPPPAPPPPAQQGPSEDPDAPGWGAPPPS